LQFYDRNAKNVYMPTSAVMSCYFTRLYIHCSFTYVEIMHWAVCLKSSQWIATKVMVPYMRRALNNTRDEITLSQTYTTISFSTYCLTNKFLTVMNLVGEHCHVTHCRMSLLSLNDFIFCSIDGWLVQPALSTELSFWHLLLFDKINSMISKNLNVKKTSGLI